MRTVLFCLFLLCVSTPSAEAAYTLRNGKLVNAKYVVEFPLEKHFTLGLEALKEKNFDEAVRQFTIITMHFPEAAKTKEAYYFLGIAFYELSDMQWANSNFSTYLEVEKNPAFLLDTFTYKLSIANAYKNGAKKHLLNQQFMPQWLSGVEDALTIYDEVIQTLSSNEIAKTAFLHKASLLTQEQRFKEGLETYERLIKQFPHTSEALQAHLLIGETLLTQSILEPQNPDILPLAKQNLKKTKAQFPVADKEREELVLLLQKMKEHYAQGLFETGKLYERKSLPKASLLYYTQVIKQFPDTLIAEKCKEKLELLQEKNETTSTLSS